MSKILVVEDEEVNLRLASELLEMNGHVVFQARDGKAGVKLAQIINPDLILMDIEMPIMDGFEAMKLLKSNKDTSHIKIIALTARAMVGDEDMIRAAGADHYLSKPYKYQELLNLINKYCAKS